MNIFGVGPMELMVIAVLAIVVLGPERFPQAAVQIAKAIKFLRGYASESTADLRAEFSELTKEYEEMRKELNEVRSGVYKHLDVITKEVSTVQGEVQTAVKQTPIGELRQLLSEKPIIEPGGELPPEYQKGANGTNGASSGPLH